MSEELVPRQLEDAVADSLAFDDACGYFNDEQLCLRYDLGLDQLQRIRKQTAYRRLVDDVERKLKDDGEEFLLKARDYSMNALEVLNAIAQDEGVSAAVRHKAAKDICEMAGMKRKPTEEGSKLPGIVINTNLTLGGGGQSKGLYTIKADRTLGAPVLVPPSVSDGEDLVS